MKGFAFSHTDDFPDLGSASDWSCRVGNLHNADLGTG